MSRLLASGTIVLLLASAPAAQSPPSGEIQAVAEYPPQDRGIWNLVRPGLLRMQAAQLSPEPGSVDAIRLYASTDVALTLENLRLIVDSYPQRIGPALEALGEAVVHFMEDSEAARQHVSALRQFVADARLRLPALPREDAARADRQLIGLDANLLTTGNRGDAWTGALERFVDEYRGTEAALLAEVDLIGAGRVSQEMLDRLHAFVERHPGTTAAAKALYAQGFQWHTINTIGTIEPRGADPAPRLLRVAAIVNELESGRYPSSEWVDKAPSLVVGFFTPDDTAIPPASVDAMLAAYEQFVRSHFRIDAEYPAGGGVGYVIISKMGDLFALKGNRVAGVERVLDDLERTGPDPDAVRYLRGVFLMEAGAASSAGGDALFARSRQILAALAAEGQGPHHRRALATHAAMEFEQQNWSAARDAYRRYAAAYPQSAWAWVAALRIGQCDERLGEPQAAAAAYLAAAERYADLPVARVLGYEYAARAYETAGAFDLALTSRERALEGWDNRFGMRYSTHVRGTPKSDDPFVPVVDVGEVTKESLAPRIAQLRTSLATPGGDRLEHGRSLVAQGRYVEAAEELQRTIAQYSGSPLVAEVRSLAHRARLERALQLADVERADRDEATALEALEALAREPLDFAVTAARIARASLLWTRGERAEAEATLQGALTAWHTEQRVPTPAPGLQEDVAAIRRAVFLPRGGGIYEGSGWNAFDWSDTGKPFFIVNADIRVRFHDDDVARVRLVQQIPNVQNVLFLDTDQIALLTRVMTSLGGTRRQEPRQIMEVPNQPVGSSTQILRLWTAFFPARPGHWGGWELETYPVITEIHFTDGDRTRAAARVTIGYSGGTVELEKVDGAWIARRLTHIWIT